MDRRPLEIILAQNVKELCRRRPDLWSISRDEPNQSKVAAACTKAGKPVNQSTVQRVLEAGRNTKLSTVKALAVGLGQKEAWILLVPNLNPDETLFLSTNEAIDRARQAHYGTEARSDHRSVPGPAPDRDGARVRAKVRKGRQV